MTYSFKFKQSTKKNQEDKFDNNSKIFSYVKDDKNLISYLSENFENIEHLDFGKKDVLNYIDENSTTLLTNVSKIHKQTKVNSYFYKETKSNHNIIVYHNGDFDLNKQNSTNIFNIKEKVCDVKPNIYNLIKKQKRNVEKILLIWDGQVDMAYKISGVWRVKNFEELLILFSEKNKLAIDSRDSILPVYLSNNSLFIEGVEIVDNKLTNNNFKGFNKLIDWITSDFFISETRNLNKYSSFVYDKTIIKNIDHKRFDEFVNGFNEKNKFSEIEIKLTKINELTFDLESEFGKTRLCLINGKREIEIISNYAHIDELKLIDYNRSILKMIKLETEPLENKRIKPVKIVQAIIGLIILIVLFYVTFTFIFDVDLLADASKIIFSIESLTSPWLYLILFFTFTTMMLPLITSIFMEKAVLKKEKLEFKRLWIYYVASLFRKIVIFFTGNYFIAIFVWGWYLNKKLKIATTSIFTTITSTSIMRAAIYSVVGGIFMISGTISYFTEYTNGPLTNSEVVVVSMAWCGFAFEVISGVWMSLLLVSPLFLAFVNNLILKFKFIFKDVTNSHLETSYKNLYSIQRDSVLKDMFKDKPLFWRTFLVICLPIFIQGFETLIFFDWIDSSVLKASGFESEFELYTNFFSLSGTRLMANMVHKFPLINLMPGQGTGFTEFGLNTLYKSIFESHHPDPSVWGSYTSDDMAQMTTFATRFFNVYLQMSIIIIMAILTLLYEFIFSKDKKEVVL